MFGRPNITGEILGTTKSGWENSNGCFFALADKQSLGNWAGGDHEGSQMFRMEANRNSSIYGASGMVQPPALMLLPCIKI